MVRYTDEKLEPSRYAVVSWFGLDDFEPERAVTSHWISPSWFLAVRFVLCLYSTIVMWGNIGYSAEQGSFRYFFAFFTNLTFIGLHAYLVTATYHHVCYLLAKPRSPSSFFNQPAILNYLYVYLYHTVVVFNIITPVIYWAALSEDLIKNASLVPSMEWWTTVSVHGVSFVLMITDVLLNRMKMRINMVIPVLATVLFYMFLTFIIHATDGWWVYPFLDWSKGAVEAGWYLGVAAAFVVVFFVQVGVHWLRDRVACKMHGTEEKKEIDQTPV